MISNLEGIQQTDVITSADYFDPEEYQMGFGDNIWISFPGGVPFARSEESVSTIILPVGLDGRLSVPGMPPINVDGLNLAELQSIIEQMVRRSYGDFAVTSGLARSASFEIPVTGQVANPGIVTVNGLTRLSEALEEAGGVTATGSLSRILIIHAGEDSCFVDLNRFTTRGDMMANPLMRRNSRIHLYSSQANIVIEGSLQSVYQAGMSPGDDPRTSGIAARVVIEFIPGETPQLALERAGGVSPEADINSCYVSRTDAGSGIVIIPFSLQRGEGTCLLQPGDRIVVPSSERFINVTGEVVQPSPVSYSPGMTVSYYIGMVGGFSPTARRNGVKLLFSDGEKISAELTDIVPPGATVEVPRVAVQFWQEYLAILTGVATVVISYQSLFQ